MRRLISLFVLIWLTCTFSYADLTMNGTRVSFAGLHDRVYLKRYSFHGDSMVDGTGEVNLWSFRKVFQQLQPARDYILVGEYNTPRADSVYWTAHNGYGGQRSDQIEARMDAELDAYMPVPNPVGSTVIILAGTNDCIQGVSAAIAVGHISDMVNIVKAHDSTLKILIGLVPPDSISTTIQNRMITLNALILSTFNGVSGITVFDAWTPIYSVTNWQTLYYVDQWHLNNAGQLILGTVVATCLVNPNAQYCNGH